MIKKIKIKNSLGEIENFDESKLVNSLIRAGASNKNAYQINEIIKADIEGKEVLTKIIYQKAFALLKKTEHGAALRYSMRRSLLEIGPSGFPFEQFIEDIFRRKGYQVATGQIIQGRCIEHEIDIFAENESEIIFIEAKYHNDLETKSDAKVALYVKSRFEDLMHSPVFSKSKKKVQGILITNTKFSDAAKKYGECSSLNMIGWDYPKEKNLYSLMEETGVFPITCLSTLTQSAKRELISAGISSCVELIEKQGFLTRIGLNEKQKEAVVNEAILTCGK